MLEQVAPTVPPEDPLHKPGTHSHIVTTYHDDGALARTVARYLHDGVEQGDLLLLIITPENLKNVEAQLRRHGHDPDDLRSRGQLVVLDAQETLSALIPNRAIDPSRFRAVIGGSYRRAVHEAHPRVRAYGEMVDLLWQEGDLQQAMLLERCWEDFTASHAMLLLCAYRVSFLAGEAESRAVKDMVQHHTHTVLGEDRTGLDHTVETAYREVLGPETADRLAPLIHGSVHPNRSLGTAEKVIFWLQRNMPDQVPAVLREARRSYGTSGVRQ